MPRPLTGPRRWRWQWPGGPPVSGVMTISQGTQRGAPAAIVGRSQPDRGDSGPAVGRPRRSTGGKAGARRPATHRGVSLDTVRQVIRARRLQGPLLRRRIVRRSGVGHAARPASGRNRAASRAGIVALHRRRRSGDDRAALDQDDDRRRAVQAAGRSSRRTPHIRRTVAGASDAMRRYFGEVGKLAVV